MFESMLKRIPNPKYLVFEFPRNPAFIENLKKIIVSSHEKNNDYIKVVMDIPRKARSTGLNSQNHHLNGHIMQICNETGNDYDTIKNIVKIIAVEQFGYPFKTIAGHIVPQGERDCDTKECAMLIEAAHYLAAELEIVLREE